MRIRFILSLGGLAVFLLAGCATRPGPVPMDPSALAGLTEEERKTIEAGEVKPGFTEEMVLAAVGRPDRKLRQVTAEGGTTLWIYDEPARRARFSFGVGAGTARGGGAYGGGVSVSPGGRPAEERLRVTFAEGRVVAVQGRESGQSR